MHMQQRINDLGDEDLWVDGIWGPKSQQACRRYLLGLMPHPHPWPKSDQQSLTAFYGAAGDEKKLVAIDVTGLNVLYEGREVKKIRVHHKCAESLLRVIKAISQSEFAYVLGQYAGVYNNRLMRGGSLPSMHARGAAIDLMPSTNGMRTIWPTDSTMPLEVVEMFAKEGWHSLGAFANRDAMHFECSRI